MNRIELNLGHFAPWQRQQSITAGLLRYSSEKVKGPFRSHPNTMKRVLQKARQMVMGHTIGIRFGLSNRCLKSAPPNSLHF